MKRCQALAVGDVAKVKEKSSNQTTLLLDLLHSLFLEEIAQRNMPLILNVVEHLFEIVLMHRRIFSCLISIVGVFELNIRVALLTDRQLAILWLFLRSLRLIT